MNSVTDLAESIHLKILNAASRYRKCEAEMIDLIQQVDRHRVFIRKGYSTLFEYATKALKLSESVSLVFISIARKASEIPELKSEIHSGNITLSNARRIVPILTPANKDEWILKAKTLSFRQLEKEVVKLKPEEATYERASYVASNRVKLEIGFSESDMLALRRVQDLMSQRLQKSASLEEVVCKLVQDYLKKQDPLERAKRSIVRNSSDVARHLSKIVNRQRTAIPAAILHRVNLRDQRRCTHINPDGKRCNQTRWLDVHHTIPVNRGGQNTLENLTTLCSNHHKFIHNGNFPNAPTTN